MTSEYDHRLDEPFATFGYSLATSKCSPPKTGKNESEEESSELGRPTSVVDNPKIEIETNEVESRLGNPGGNRDDVDSEP